jgi:hypothetical protein
VRVRHVITGDDIGRVTGWHRSKISRIELGQAEIGVVDAIHYLAACKVFASEATEVLALCRDAERKLGYWLSPHGEWLEDTLNSLIYHAATAGAGLEERARPHADRARRRVADVRPRYPHLNEALVSIMESVSLPP